MLEPDVIRRGPAIVKAPFTTVAGAGAAFRLQALIARSWTKSVSGKATTAVLPR